MGVARRIDRARKKGTTTGDSSAGQAEEPAELREKAANSEVIYIFVFSRAAVGHCDKRAAPKFATRDRLLL